MVKKEYICDAGKKSKIVIEDFSVQIKEGSTLILGFAGIGLIGPIVANQLIEQVPDIKEIGFLVSDYLPPISVFYEGVLKHPFRFSRWATLSRYSTETDTVGTSRQANSAQLAQF